MSSVATSSQSSGNGTPWGAVAQAGASVVNNLVDNIFDSNLKKQAQQYQQALSILTNEQQANLNKQLLAAQTDTDRMSILTNAVAQVEMNKNSSATSILNNPAFIVLMGVVVLVIAINFINK